MLPASDYPARENWTRRFRLHPNTVSAGYRQLEREQWVELGHGSGVFVRGSKPDVSAVPALALDRLIANLFSFRPQSGTPLASVRTRLRQWLELQPPDHFLLIEPDEELRRILAAEMQQAVTFPVRSCGLEHTNLREAVEGAIPVVLPSKANAARKALPDGTELLTLQIRRSSAIEPSESIENREGEALLLGSMGAIAGGFFGRDFPLIHGKVIYKR